MRLVETSNTALLLSEATSVGGTGEAMATDDDVCPSPPPPSTPTQRRIEGRVSRHYELVHLPLPQPPTTAILPLSALGAHGAPLSSSAQTEIRPQLHHLRTLLTAQPYSPLRRHRSLPVHSSQHCPLPLTSHSLCRARIGGQDDEEVDPSSLCSLADLRRRIQASDAQLDAALHSLFAYEVDGYYRTLHPAYQHAIITDALNALTETQQSPLSIDAALLAATLSHLHSPSLIVRTVHLLAPYTPDPAFRLALCPRILARQHAAYLFSSSSSIPASTLLPTLTSYLPPPLAFDPSHLIGLALYLQAPGVAAGQGVWALATGMGVGWGGAGPAAGAVRSEGEVESGGDGRLAGGFVRGGGEGGGAAV